MPFGHGDSLLTDSELPIQHLDHTDTASSSDNHGPPPTTINPRALFHPNLSANPDSPTSSHNLPQVFPNEMDLSGDDIALSNGHGGLHLARAGSDDALDQPASKRLRPNPLPISSLKTGLCYDVRMRFHATVDAEDLHPEDPRRIYEIYKALCQAGLVDDPEYTGIKRTGDLMHRIDARLVKEEEAMLVHSVEHWNFLAGTERELEVLRGKEWGLWGCGRSMLTVPLGWAE